MQKTGEEYVAVPRLPRLAKNTRNDGEGTVECETEHATGEAIRTDEVRTSRCASKAALVRRPCHDAWLPAGEIETDTLKGRLGYINKATHEVGVLLEPSNAGGVFAAFEIINGGGEMSWASATPPKGRSGKTIKPWRTYRA